MICARRASPCYFDILREHVRSRQEISPVRYLMRNDRTSVPSVAILVQVDFCIIQSSSCAMSTASSRSGPSSSKSSSDSESDESTTWTENEGDSSENDEEVPAAQSLRGQAALVTASCPRRYPRALKDRRRMNIMIPEVFSTCEMLQKFRRTVLLTFFKMFLNLAETITQK